MTCTTFLYDGELNQRLPDQQAQEFLDEVRRKSGNDWQVVKLPERRVGLFRKKAPPMYGVYVYIGGCGPWQQINFYHEDATSSINLYVPLDVVVAYFMGMANGLSSAPKKDRAS